MNERILELAIKAREYAESKPDIYQVAYDKKFAELLIRECATMAECFHRNQYDYTGDLELHEFIKQHFGVEE